MWKKFLQRWPLSALYWLPTGIAFNQYMYTLKIITGSSMQPTLNPESSLWRDVAIFDRFHVHTLYHPLARGDVVALRDPIKQKLIVKRIIALEGDIVKTLPPCPDTEVLVPAGHAWVEGDEPFRSHDSNIFGPVPLALIDSKLLFIMWPLARVGPLVHKYAQSVTERDQGLREPWRKSRVQEAM